MSRRLLCTALWVAACATPGAAQTPAQLSQRIARLTSAFARAETARLRADSAARARIAFDTIRAGPMRVLAARSIVSAVAPAVDSGWRALEATFGQSARFVGQQTMVVQFWGQAEGNIPFDSPNVLNLPAAPPTDLVTRYVIQQGSRIVRQTEDAQLTSWLSPQLAPGGPALDRLDVVYVELATSPRSKARSCYVGDLVACRAALGLTGREDPVRAWYDAADRRAIVRRFGRLGGDVGRCQRDGADEACEAALRLIPPAQLPLPVSPAAQLSLLQIVLDAGGPGAYDRLRSSVAANRSIEERLALTARVESGDSLLSAWRAKVLAARPHTVEVTAPSAWAAVFWGVALGFLALRSTRWR